MNILIREAKHIVLGEMYISDNITESVIDTSDIWHALSLSEITAGTLAGWTYADGVRGIDITAFATSDEGARTKVTVTAAHNLAVGDPITISGTTNYNDIYLVMEIVDANNFTIDKAWDTNDDATGTYARGGMLTAGVLAAGYYGVNWNVSISPEVNNHIFAMGLMHGKVPCVKSRARQKLGVAGDYNTMAAHALCSIAVGDKLSFVIKNIGAAGNFTIRHGNANAHNI